MCVPVCPSGVFLENELHPDRHSHLGWENFTELFLSNIMEYGKNYIEWQTSIQGMSLSDFWNYLKKWEWSFKLYSELRTQNDLFDLIHSHLCYNNTIQYNTVHLWLFFYISFG